MVLRTANTWIKERQQLGGVSAANEVFLEVEAAVMQND